ncbi:MAG: GMC family oxidoreductase N-terminal domain-containing protein [Candidatus Omnitrophica bacterium]|nr:GMC family oxidoreductase N-terminal domain-containing protein [Candidatus Omnitrophota bacterium]
MNNEFEYIIVGGGLCGLVLAKELAGRGQDVLVLEKGNYVNKMGTLERTLSFYDKFALAKSVQGIPIYRAFGIGGTSLISCGNAVEFTREEYNRIGIDILSELPAAKLEGHVKTDGLNIGKASAKIMEEANALGYTMGPMPKFSMTEKCASCGNCYLGCRFGTKWTSVNCIKEVHADHLTIVTGFDVDKVIISHGKTIGISGQYGKSRSKRKYFANTVILSAGGIGTPIILQKSGIKSGENLFIDIFNVTYGESKEYKQRNELSMSVVCDKFHVSDGFVLAPFVDNWYGFLGCAEPKDIAKAAKMKGVVGIMTKIADDNIGRVHSDNKIDKKMTQNDTDKLKKGTTIATEILTKCGVEPRTIFVTKPRGAHPGGTAAIGKVVNGNLETEIKNLFVCDASVLPFAPGLPPMLSLVAMTKWFCKNSLLRTNRIHAAYEPVFTISHQTIDKYEEVSAGLKNRTRAKKTQY